MYGRSKGCTTLKNVPFEFSRYSVWGISPFKVMRLMIVLSLSFLCWLGVGYAFFGVLQLVGH
jgi:hypothetical protein